MPIDVEVLGAGISENPQLADVLLNSLELVDDEGNALDINEIKSQYFGEGKDISKFFEDFDIEDENEKEDEKDIIKYSKYQKLLNEKKTVQGKLRELEAAREAELQKTMAEQGKYKELFDSVNTKATTLQEENEALKEQLAVYLEREEAHRQALLRDLPKEIREDFADAKVEQLQKIAAFLKSKAQSDSLTQPTSGMKAGVKEAQQKDAPPVSAIDANRRKIASLFKIEQKYS